MNWREGIPNRSKEDHQKNLIIAILVERLGGHCFIPQTEIASMDKLLSISPISDGVHIRTKDRNWRKIFAIPVDLPKEGTKAYHTGPTGRVGNDVQKMLDTMRAKQIEFASRDQHRAITLGAGKYNKHGLWGGSGPPPTTHRNLD